LRRNVLAIVIAVLILAGAITYLYRGVIEEFFIPKPRVNVIGIIRIYGYIVSEQDLELYLASIDYARANESIVSIVLRIDSPGGYATMVEDIYYSLKELSKEKPVVAVVEGMAASGGYYVALAADRIIAVPTSFIGSIGVIGYLPPIVIPSEGIIETGPYKHAGFSLKKFPFLIRRALDNFVQAILENRADKLKASIDDLIQGEVYLGRDALDMGLIDDIGSLEKGIELAAELAEVEVYVVEDITERVREHLDITPYGWSLWQNNTLLSFSILRKVNHKPLEPLYLFPIYLNDSSTLELSPLLQGSPYYPIYPIAPPAKGKVNVKGAVLIDSSHRNMYEPALLSTFLGKLVEHGMKVYIVTADMNLTRLILDRPRALIVINPGIDYSPREVKAIINYVKAGGILILVYDPAFTYVKPMNQLAQWFGMYFTNSYLYNLRLHYGVYKYIYVDNFKEHILTKGLRRLLMLTATCIYTNGTLLALTDEDTISSFTEKQGVYGVIAINGSVLAIGDLAFLLDPFIVLEDNEAFASNVVEWILSTANYTKP